MAGQQYCAENTLIKQFTSTFATQGAQCRSAAGRQSMQFQARKGLLRAGCTREGSRRVHMKNAHNGILTESNLQVTMQSDLKTRSADQKVEAALVEAGFFRSTGRHMLSLNVFARKAPK